MPSNQAKQKWNAVHYTQVKVSVKPEIAAAFKEACTVNGVSQAAVLSDLMIKYAKSAPATASPAKNNLDSRRKRRLALKNLTLSLEALLNEEERYYDAVPENLQGSRWHEASESSVAVINDIIALLSEVYE